MSLKPLEIPERVLIDAALKRRINLFHPTRTEIEEDYQHRMTGYRGEKAISYFLDKLAPDQFDIIHDLRLPCPNRDDFFQIDKLVLSTLILPVNIEVKNWKCDIHFDKHLDQVIKIYPEKNKRVRAQNPVLQAREQAQQLGIWLAQHDFGHIPIEYLFANGNEKSIITADLGMEHILKNVCTGETLIDKINRIDQLPNSFTKSSLKILEDALLAAHTPPIYDIQKMYNISPKEIIPGVHCPKCELLAMFYKNGIWICPHCHYQSKTAFLPSINDYFLLIKPTITNAELRWFLQISSPDTATHILQSLNLPHNGSKKGRIYFKPEKNFPIDE
ncbi:MAG: NERD domain-containing protein [Bacillota bacterium]|nr:NERD domain-containing protein [Bacillota bacterium]